MEQAQLVTQERGKGDSSLEVFAYASKLVRRDMQAAVEMFRRSQQQHGEVTANKAITS
jgi:hypothetical protein